MFRNSASGKVCKECGREFKWKGRSNFSALRNHANTFHAKQLIVEAEEPSSKRQKTILDHMQTSSVSSPFANLSPLDKQVVTTSCSFPFLPHSVVDDPYFKMCYSPLCTSLETLANRTLSFSKDTWGVKMPNGYISFGLLDQSNEP